MGYLLDERYSQPKGKIFNVILSEN
jgi:hypothetical protein